MRLSIGHHLNKAENAFGRNDYKAAQKHFVAAMLGYYGKRPKSLTGRARKALSIGLIRVALFLIPNESAK